MGLFCPSVKALPSVISASHSRTSPGKGLLDGFDSGEGRTRNARGRRFDPGQLHMDPVDPRRIAIAAKVLDNADIIATTCRLAGVPFTVACALFEKESLGRNVYGHDAGGALAGFPGEVNAGNFEVFEWLVFTVGQTSNGVGPSQITYPGFFTDMKAKNLRPYRVHENMLYGLQLLRQHRDASSSWAEAGTLYNAGNLKHGVNEYGRDLEAKIAAWRSRWRGV